MEQVQFDTAGFAIGSGFVIAYTTDNAGVFTSSEEQWISEGCGLAANAYLDPPPKTKQGFAIVRTEIRGKNRTSDQWGNHCKRIAYRHGVVGVQCVWFA